MFNFLAPVTLFVTLIVLIFTPVCSKANDLIESTLTFQEQVGQHSTYYWRAVVTVPEGLECTVTVFVTDGEGNRLLQAVGPALSANAIFGQQLTVPTAQTALWSRMHTSLGCG
jgi:hypothetical protein